MLVSLTGVDCNRMKNYFQDFTVTKLQSSIIVTIFNFTHALLSELRVASSVRSE